MEYRLTPILHWQHEFLPNGFPYPKKYTPDDKFLLIEIAHRKDDINNL